MRQKTGNAFREKIHQFLTVTLSGIGASSVSIINDNFQMVNPAYWIHFGIREPVSSLQMLTGHPKRLSENGSCYCGDSKSLSRSSL